MTGLLCGGWAVSRPGWPHVLLKLDRWLMGGRREGTLGTVSSLCHGQLHRFIKYPPFMDGHVLSLVADAIQVRQLFQLNLVEETHF